MEDSALILLFVVVLIPIIVLVFFRAYEAYEAGKTLLGHVYREEFDLKYWEVSRLNEHSKTLRQTFKAEFCIETVIRLYLDVARELPPKQQMDMTFNYHLLDYGMRIIQDKYHFPSDQKASYHRDHFSQEVLSVIDRRADLVPELTDDQEWQLFYFDYNRWGRVYDLVIRDFDARRPDLFYREICRFRSTNPKIGTVVLRNLYFKAYNFMAAYDKKLSLKLYIHYLSVKSHSDTFKYKEISRRNASRLFATNEQKVLFGRICRQFQKNDKLEDAFKKIETLYAPVRRKISLNNESIQDAREKQYEVARLLDAYLNEEEKTLDASSDLEYRAATSDAIILAASGAENQVLSAGMAIISADEPPPSLPPPAPSLPPPAPSQPPAPSLPPPADNKVALLDLFISHSFRLNRQEVDIFASSKGLFRDGFIESINEEYYDLLDDLLIEEEEDEYVLNEDYYQQIRGK